MGANWFTAKTDDYIRFSQVENGMNKSIVCKGVTDYQSDCPISSGMTFSPQLTVFGLVSFFIYILK